MNYKELPHDGAQWGALVSMVMYLQMSQKMGNFMTRFLCDV